MREERRERERESSARKEREEREDEVGEGEGGVPVEESGGRGEREEREREIERSVVVLQWKVEGGSWWKVDEMYPILIVCGDLCRKNLASKTSLLFCGQPWIQGCPMDSMSRS